MISFIVPAHNEERLLGNTLAALNRSARALGEAFEIIVVNDGSTDATAPIAAGAGARVLTVDVRQIGAARNAGAHAATGEFLIFVDADTVVNETTIVAARDALRAGAVGGGAMIRWEGKLPIWARAAAVVTRWSMRIGGIASGCFVFATRSAFESVGGFDARLYATEEIALSRALKRLGPFVILRDEVLTSGRKLRTYSVFEVAGMLAAVAVRGWHGVRDRRHLSLWYGERRNE